MTPTSIGRSRSIAIAGLAGTLILVIVPLVAFRYFPSEDGPSHAALAVVVDSLVTSSGHRLNDFYVLNDFPVPNVLGTIALAILQGPLASPIAERVFVGILVVGFAMATWYVLGGVRRESVFLASIAAPVGLGLVTHLGFLNFVAGLVVSIVAIGYWQRSFNPPPRTPVLAPSLLQVVVLAGLLLLTYLGHLLPLLAAVFVMAVVPIVSSAADVPRTDPRVVARVATWLMAYWRRVRWVVLAAVPAGALSLAYLARSHDSVSSVGRDLIGRIVWLASFGELLAALSRAEVAVSIVMAVVVVALVVVALRRRIAIGRTVDRGDGYLLAAAGMGFAYLAVPAEIGGGSAVSERIAIFVFIVALVWIAHFRFPESAQIAVIVAAMVVSGGLTAMRWSAYGGFDRDLAEYTSAVGVIRPETTVLPLALIPTDATVADLESTFRVRPLVEASSLYTALSDAVDLNHLHAAYDYSPAYFASDRTPALHLAVPPGTPEPISAVPPSVDVPGFESSTGETVDYILLWGRTQATPEVIEEAEESGLLALLAADYDLIFTSPDRGLLEVFARVPSG